MKRNRARSLTLGLFLAVMFVFGVGSATAEAQTRRGGFRRPSRVIVYRPYYYDPFWYRRYDPFWDPFYYQRRVAVDPVAYARERGFSEGKDEGEEDAEKGRPANWKGHEDYLKSDSLAFREGFAKGYDAGYQEELAETTKEMREKGRSKGREDARKGRAADPSAHKDYLKATSRTYREAFVQGYHELYRAQAAARRDGAGR